MPPLHTPCRPALVPLSFPVSSGPSCSPPQQELYLHLGLPLSRWDQGQGLAPGGRSSGQPCGLAAAAVSFSLADGWGVAFCQQTLHAQQFSPKQKCNPCTQSANLLSPQQLSADRPGHGPQRPGLKRLLASIPVYTARLTAGAGKKGRHPRRPGQLLRGPNTRHGWGAGGFLPCLRPAEEGQGPRRLGGLRRADG